MPDRISYAALSNVLPPQRLSLYEKVFRTTDPIAVHGAYIWSVKAAASLYPLLSALEVSLRNAIHNSASQAIAPDWYDKLRTKVRKSWQVGKRDQSNINWHKAQVLDVKKKLAYKTAPKGFSMHDLLVAKMDFGFWDNLLRECFSVNGDRQALWPQCIPAVFPNLPKGYTNADVQRAVSLLRELRNDIAHHSPIWKHKQVVDEVSVLAFLQAQLNDIIRVIGWLSKDKVDWLEVHMLQSEARRVISKEYLWLCQRRNVETMQVRYSCYKRGFRTKLKTLDQDHFNLIRASDDGLYMLTKIS